MIPIPGPTAYTDHLTPPPIAGLIDARPGASVNALTSTEVEAIVFAFETFGQKDFSHRRLAHRGSYENLFWAAPCPVHGAARPERP